MRKVVKKLLIKEFLFILFILPIIAFHNIDIYINLERINKFGDCKYLLTDIPIILPDKTMQLTLITSISMFAISSFLIFILTIGKLTRAIKIFYTIIFLLVVFLPFYYLTFVNEPLTSEEGKKVAFLTFTTILFFLLYSFINIF